MQLRSTALAFAAAALLPTAASAQPKLDSLAFLAGQWRGTTNEGRQADEIYSTPEGGMIVGIGREFDATGKCVFYDLEVFVETPKGLVFRPSPMGKAVPIEFPLVAAESGPNKAVFVNEKNDFPKRLVWELVAPDEMRITLTGAQKGQPVTAIYQLKRVGTTQR
ncbi:MAG: hypothetical protein JSR82_08440 [Verrucomicrobia bacterium]|nr:hypothetical protein [Verrucomicrobiota bacterium]